MLLIIAWPFLLGVDERTGPFGRELRIKLSDNEDGILLAFDKGIDEIQSNSTTLMMKRIKVILFLVVAIIRTKGRMNERMNWVVDVVDDDDEICKVWWMNEWMNERMKISCCCCWKVLCRGRN